MSNSVPMSNSVRYTVETVQDEDGEWSCSYMLDGVEEINGYYGVDKSLMDKYIQSWESKN